MVEANGHLGTTTSSARFKEAIKSMDKTSEAMPALQPVTFRYKHELDPEGIPQFGLVAEQVEKVNPDLVARDEQGKPYTVRYEAVNAMLLNEFIKEHRKVEEQQGKISDLKTALAQQGRDLRSAIARQQEEIRALSASLQRVSNQLELMNAGTRVVANDQ
jgi:septal ring factor EnvC (AmiA/AmiB activator)